MGAFLVVVLALGVFYIVQALVSAAVNEHFRKMSYQKKHGHLYYGILLLLIAVFFFVVAVSMLSAVFTTLQTFAIVASLLLLTASYHTWRQYRTSRRQFWLHLAASLGMAMTAILLLVVAF